MHRYQQKVVFVTTTDFWPVGGNGQYRYLYIEHLPMSYCDAGYESWRDPNTQLRQPNANTPAVQNYRVIVNFAEDMNDLGRMWMKSSLRGIKYRITRLSDRDNTLEQYTETAGAQGDYTGVAYKIESENKAFEIKSARLHERFVRQQADAQNLVQPAPDEQLGWSTPTELHGPDVTSLNTAAKGNNSWKRIVENGKCRTVHLTDKRNAFTLWWQPKSKADRIYNTFNLEKARRGMQQRVQGQAETWDLDQRVGGVWLAVPAPNWWCVEGGQQEQSCIATSFQVEITAYFSLSSRI